MHHNVVHVNDVIPSLQIMRMYASTEVKLQMMKQCVRPMVTRAAALCMLAPVFFAMMAYWFVSSLFIVVARKREQKSESVVVIIVLVCER